MVRCASDQIDRMYGRRFGSRSRSLFARSSVKHEVQTRGSWAIPDVAWNLSPRRLIIALPADKNAHSDTEPAWQPKQRSRLPSPSKVASDLAPTMVKKREGERFRCSDARAARLDGASPQRKIGFNTSRTIDLLAAKRPASGQSAGAAISPPDPSFAPSPYSASSAIFADACVIKCNIAKDDCHVYIQLDANDFVPPGCGSGLEPIGMRLSKPWRGA